MTSQIHLVSARVAFYHAPNKFLKAVLGSNLSGINLPITPVEWEKMRKGLAFKRVNQVIKRCVAAALDGVSQPTLCSTIKESDGFPRAYCLGHYQSYGLNCQSSIIQDCNSYFLQ